jgi:hypothetical protein
MREHARGFRTSHDPEYIIFLTKSYCLCYLSSPVPSWYNEHTILAFARAGAEQHMISLVCSAKFAKSMAHTDRMFLEKYFFFFIEPMKESTIHYYKVQRLYLRGTLSTSTPPPSQNH